MKNVTCGYVQYLPSYLSVNAEMFDLLVPNEKKVVEICHFCSDTSYFGFRCECGRMQLMQASCASQQFEFGWSPIARSMNPERMGQPGGGFLKTNAAAALSL